MSSQPPNRLMNASSPYLLQHALNPVDWYEWGEEALQKARLENKPILLSIGYSACHWCHVMAHESFEDLETAAVMNELYVNIKVDREERPDLDKIYQLAQQMLNQKMGGWPLTMILTPSDHIPLFGGTYFPREARFNLPPFKQILQRVSAFYHQRQDDTEQHKVAFRAHLAHLDRASDSWGAVLTDEPLQAMLGQLEEQFDRRYGGFGEAPKFPQVSNLDFLLRQVQREQQAGGAGKKWLRRAAFSMQQMIRGGLYDHVGGGFFRYSVDERWEIPHFEKMLYDNGPLLALCARLWQITGHHLFRQAAEETADWVMREMQAPEGGYYASLDADSEGVEGKFYVWYRDQLEAALGEDLELASACFGLNQPANFEGAWHFVLGAEREELGKRFGLTDEALDIALERIKTTLLATRDERDPPGRDDKMLGSWNALMIRGMARAGAVLGCDDWVGSAQQALDAVHDHLWVDGRLLAAYKDDVAHLGAYLDDYAYLIDAILELLQSRWRTRDLNWAIELAEVLCAHFQDVENGGFYFTADDHEDLIHRPKPFTDDSMASGNGVAALALNRLGYLLGEPRYLEVAEGCVRAAWTSMLQMPMGHGALLGALCELLRPPQLLIVRGTEENLAPWRERLNSACAPSSLSFLIDDTVCDLPEALASKTPVAGKTTAYLCTGSECQPPVADIDALESILAASEIHAKGHL